MPIIDTEHLDKPLIATAIRDVAQIKDCTVEATGEIVSTNSKLMILNQRQSPRKPRLELMLEAG
jgi:hypothetical protein